MNKVILMGRITRDPETRYSAGDNATCVAKYTLAIDRIKTKNNQEPGTDFINCVAFGRNGEFAEKYLKKGMKILVEGKITTGSYTNKEGQKVYTTEVTVSSQEFCEKRESNPAPVSDDGFNNIPEGMQEELPFD